MKITLSHGNGAEETSELIENIFWKHFRNEFTRPEDAAVLPFEPGCGGGSKFAFTTDSFVVKPLFFPGGDIGRLAVCGTVNDLLTTGGTPLYLSASFIIEENCDTEILEKIAASMRAAADEAGVKIVTGDTKVIEGSGGVYVNTAGIAHFGHFVAFNRSADESISLRGIREGDAVLISGTLGDHHACILSRRMEISNGIKSDAAPLGEMVNALVKQIAPARGVHVHGLRDVTRGGLATVLNEVSAVCGLACEIDEEALPVADEVRGFCKILGLDPLYMGNEGKMVVVVPNESAEQALEILRASKYGERAAIIGRFGGAVRGERVVLKTKLGGMRNIPPMSGEGLPRIC